MQQRRQCRERHSFRNFLNRSRKRQIEGEIQFTNASYGGSGNFTYVWDFGDGTTSTEENPKHVYNEKGIFVVSLTITDSSGRSNLYRKTIEITDKVVEKGDLTLLWTSSTHLAKLVSNSAALSPDEKRFTSIVMTTYYIVMM